MARYLVIALVSLLSACSQLAWYKQAAQGQWDLLSRREPLAEVIADPDTPPALAAQLQTLQHARDFAVTILALPDNGSYRTFVNLDRNAAVWTLVVTPALSLTPQPWCYPLVGCQAYRGYFQEHKAIQQAHRWELKGYDSVVLATPAYSTLGWFDDPLLNTMLTPYDADSAGLIFHELAHQQVFAAGDSHFNEAYASWVERAGTRAWLNAKNDISALKAWENRQQWRQNYYHMLHQAREELAQVYAGQLTAAEQLAAKKAVLAALRQHLEQADWPVPEPLNNAQLAIITVYDQGVSQFAKLFECNNNDWTLFHRAAAAIAEWPRQQREHWLQDTIDTPPEVCHLTRAQQQEN